MLDLTGRVVDIAMQHHALSHSDGDLNVEVRCEGPGCTWTSKATWPQWRREHRRHVAELIIEEVKNNE